MDGLSCSAPCMNWDAPDLESAWKRFVTHADFVFNGPLKEKGKEEKCAYLMIWVGDKGRTIYENWTLTADERKRLKTYLDKFEAHVKPKTNIVYNRYKFQSRVQNEEPFDQFVIDLQTLVRDCAYDNPEEMVRDRIVFGIKSQKAREKLICEGSDLTLNKTLDLVRSYEIAKAQSQKMQGDSTVNSITENKGARPRSRCKPEKDCSRCGKQHAKNEKCPAMGLNCKKCGKPNHFAKKCRSQQAKHFKKKKFSKKVNQLECHTDDSDSSDAFYVGMVIELSGETYNVNSLTNEWLLNAEICNKTVKLQLDTGAKCNVMSEKTLKLIDAHNELRQSNSILRSYSGHNLETVGHAVLPVKVKDQTYTVKFQIVKMEQAETILGAETCTEMNLIQRINSLNKQSHVPQDIQKAFPHVFHGLGCLPEKHHITVDENIESTIHAPRKIPLAIKSKVKKELENMEKQDVIVKQREQTDWVNSMVTVIKPNGKLRICMDPKDLNKAIKREHHPLKTIEEILPQISDAKVFSKLDATSGFWQCALDSESQKLCTFNTPFGRYSFKRLPYGIKSAPEIYQRLISEMIQDIDGAEAIVDDILIWGSDMKEHDRRLNQVLQRICDYNLKLNRDKCLFRQNSVSYVGHILSLDGLKPDPEKVRAIKEMQKPENKKELMTFLGFINYLGKFIPNLSQKSAPLRLLLEKDIEWFWEKEQEDSFRALKDAVSSTPVLRYFDPTKTLTLSVDASSKGIGAVLLQENQPIAYGSRALTAPQQNYAQIDKEALAISYGCNKFHQYVFGRLVEVETDHKPLQALFNKPLLQAPPRLQRILLALQRYDIKVVYKPGTQMYISDCLSRAFLNETSEDLNSEELSINILRYLPVSEENMRRFQAETETDSVLTKLKEIILSGWPNSKKHVVKELQPYWNFRDELSVVDSLIFKAHKLVVPKSLQTEMLEKIHEAHLGVKKCKSRARDTLFWPGMSADIEVKVASCEKCAENFNKNPKEPLIITEIADRPWSKISVDLFHFRGKNFLLSVDRFSSWPEIAKLDDLSSENVIMYMKSQFSRYGIPDEVYSDNGPQFSSSCFSAFAKNYGFVHTTSSPIYPQSNGHAERGVQTIKNLLKKASDPYLSVMIYRDSVIEGIGKSPAQLFLGRRLKTTLPTTTPLLKNKSAEKVVEKRRKLQSRNKFYFDKHSSTEQTKLKVGESITMKRHDSSKWEPATVVKKQNHQDPTLYVTTTRVNYIVETVHILNPHERNSDQYQSQMILDTFQPPHRI